VNITADIVYSIQEIANLAVSDYEFKKLDKDQLVQLFSNKVLIEKFRDKKMSTYCVDKELYRNSPFIKDIFDFDENNDSSFRPMFDYALWLRFNNKEDISFFTEFLISNSIDTYISISKISIFLIKYKN